MDIFILHLWVFQHDHFHHIPLQHDWIQHDCGRVWQHDCLRQHVLWKLNSPPTTSWTWSCLPTSSKSRRCMRQQQVMRCSRRSNRRPIVESNTSSCGSPRGTTTRWWSPTLWPWFLVTTCCQWSHWIGTTTVDDCLTTAAYQLSQLHTTTSNMSLVNMVVF